MCIRDRSKPSSDYETEGNGLVQKSLLFRSKSATEDVALSSKVLGMRSSSSRNLRVLCNDQAEKTVPPPRGPGLQRIDSIRRAKGGQCAESKAEMVRLRMTFRTVVIILVQQCLQGLMTLGSVLRHNKRARLVWNTLLDLTLFAIGRSFTVVLWCLATVLTGVRVSSEWMISRKCVQKAAASLYACKGKSN